MSHDTKGCSRFCMILRDNNGNLEVCICTPDTLPTRAWLKFHTSVEIGDDLLWKGHVMCANARYWSNSDNIADFQQNFTFFWYFSWQEVILAFFSQHDNAGVLTDIERYWREWRWFRWFNRPFLILAIDRKDQGGFSHHSVNNKCKIRFPVYTSRRISVD